MKSDLWLGAYGAPYDPRPAIEAWRAGEAEQAPKELWEHLYHQGAINSASYAAVGEIVKMMGEKQAADWNAYALVATIEEARVSGQNPAVPPELQQSYSDAWANLLSLGLRDLSAATDDPAVRGILAVLAHAKGQHTLATIALCTEDERVEMLGA